MPAIGWYITLSCWPLERASARWPPSRSCVACSGRVRQVQLDTRALVFAWYIAMSALWSRVATLSPCSGASAIPVVAVTASVIPSMFIAWRSPRAGRARCPDLFGPDDVRNDDRELVTSIRATVARPLLARTRHSATSHSSRSPVSWPSVSLTSLKRSRSNSADRRPAPCLSTRRRVRRETGCGWADLVSWSCVAWCHLLSASRRSSSTSWARSIVVLA